MKIYSKFDSTNVLFEDDNTTMKKTVVAAVKSGVNLSGADLSRADLKGADLRGANLSYANLSGADLSGACLFGADLSGACLFGADLSGAYLRGAYLYRADLSGVDLSGVNLSGVNLSGVNLSGVDLTKANLTDIKEDLWKVLFDARNEVSGLLAALREGRVDGNVYEGECACLVGTIANVARKHYTELEGIKPDNSRPSERWFLAISKGDTPESNPIVKITVDWIEEFQKL